jgi:hypothetical protein
MTAHTPGPWNIQHDFNVFGGRRLVASAGGHSSNQHPLAVDAENRANASLIAAAPDLLKAVRHLFACDMAGSSVDFRCDGCEAARAAIAKAEGR